MKKIFARTATYLAVIRASPGSKMFQRCFFYEKDNMPCKPEDVCELGRFSCAFYVSCILKMFDLIRAPAVTVDSLEKEMLNSGWYELPYLVTGAVVIWEPEVKKDGKAHRHTGFYVKNKCISNNPDGDVPAEHHPTFYETRKIEKIYFHSLIA